MNMTSIGKLTFMRLHECAFAIEPPAYDGKSVGYDLRSCQTYTINPHDRAVISTGIAIQLPDGCYGRIAGRSGLAVNNGITVGGGVIDPDYTGDLKVILFNHSDTIFHIHPGTKVAQLVCEMYMRPSVCEVKCFNRTSMRGSKHFGSSD
jgi:dUTP pyrophosphatase